MDKYQNKIYSTLSTRLKKRETDLINLIKKDFNKKFKGKVLDIGCASGNLLIALSKIFPEAGLLGIDSHFQSIELARKKSKYIQKCNFKNISLQNFAKSKFDIIIACGLLTFWEDFRTPLKKILKLLKNKESKIYIFGRFNSSNVDLKIKFRNNKISSKWRDGYNTYSIQTFYKFLTKNYKIKFKKFNFNVPLKRVKGDPIRTYTLSLRNKKKILINDANLISDLYFLRIQKK